MVLWSNRPKSVQGWSESFREYAYSIQDHRIAHDEKLRRLEHNDRLDGETSVLCVQGTVSNMCLKVKIINVIIVVLYKILNLPASGIGKNERVIARPHVFVFLATGADSIRLN